MSTPNHDMCDSLHRDGERSPFIPNLEFSGICIFIGFILTAYLIFAPGIVDYLIGYIRKVFLEAIGTTKGEKNASLCCSYVQ